MMFSEDLGSCVPAWKNSSRTYGCKWDLLKLIKENTKEAGWGTGGVYKQRACFFFFFFPGVLKPH
jgi:hypothetical protein